MLGIQRHLKVTAAVALCAHTAALTAALAASAAQARPGCLEASAESLLNAQPASGPSGFTLAQRLCGGGLVRSPLPAVIPPASPEPAPAAVLPSEPPRVLAATPPPPARRHDQAGQARVRAVAPLVAQAALRHDIDPLLLHAVAHVESRHQAQAISPAGARGLMQVMPGTGRDMGLADPRELLSPEANLEASARYLKLLQARFGNDLRLVLAAYNAGEGAVERHGRRVPPYAETQAYVRNVLAVYGELRRRLAPAALAGAGQA